MSEKIDKIECAYCMYCHNGVCKNIKSKHFEEEMQWDDTCEEVKT